MSYALNTSPDRRAVKESLRRHIEFGQFETKDVTDAEVTPARIAKCWSNTEDKHLFVAELRRIVRNMAKHDRDAAARFLAEVTDAAGSGLVVSKRVPAGKATDASREMDEAIVASAKAKGVEMQALADGVVSAAERADMLNALRAAEREHVEAEYAVSALGTAERSFSEVRP